MILSSYLPLAKGTYIIDYTTINIQKCLSFFFLTCGLAKEVKKIKRMQLPIERLITRQFNFLKNLRK